MKSPQRVRFVPMLKPILEICKGRLEESVCVHVRDEKDACCRWVTLKVDESKSEFLIDTGSQVSLLNYCPEGICVKSSSLKVKSASGHPLTVSGVVDINTEFGPQRFHVCENLPFSLLGMDFLQQYKCLIDLATDTLRVGDVCVVLDRSRKMEGIVPTLNTDSNSLPDNLKAQCETLNADDFRTASALLKRFSNLFIEGNLGYATGFEHCIDLTDEKPLRKMPWRVSAAEQEIIDKEVKNMLEKGIIEPSHSSWAAPVVLSKKKDGSWRFCVDYRQLNSVTKQAIFPVPHPEDILDRLSGSNLFVSLDLNSGFWQVPLRESDRDKTAFCVRTGQFRFLRMPFGLKNATATFQSVMNSVLAHMIGAGVEVYVDDIVVHASSFEQLIERLESTFQALTDANLTLNAKKCKLFTSEINLLGHCVSGKTVTPLDDKVKVIHSWPVPKRVKELKSFLGTTSYYRKFVKDYGKIAAPLCQLTAKKAVWTWGDREQRSFDLLKRALTTTPILCQFEVGLPIIVDADASNEAIGGVISQVHEGKETVVAYFSRCLDKSERNYCATRKELLAVIEALEHWRHYLIGVQFTVRSDHSSLRWLKNFRHPEGQLARWLERLACFNFDLVHRKGSCQTNADGLSRRPCPGECNHCSLREKRESDILVCMTRLTDHSIDWKEEQSKDQDVQTVITWLSEGTKPEYEEIAGGSPDLKKMWEQFETLSLLEGVVVRKFFLPRGEPIIQTVVPKHLKFEITVMLHEQGHFGIKRTEQALMSRFYWPKWKREVFKCVSQCLVCNKRKGPQQRARLPFKKYVSSEPMQRVAVDVLGPLPTTDRGNKYLLVMCDYFTKWVEAIPIANQEAATISDVLLDFFCRFGIPLELHSDQGRNFESFLVKHMCERLRINKTRTAPYHPQSDGQCERFNRTVLAALAKICDRQNDWDRVVALVCMHYRASVHSATGVSPALLMLGRDLRLPTDVLLPPPHVEKSNYDKHLSDLEERLQKASEAARNYLHASWERMRQTSMTPRKATPLDINREVFVFNPSVKRGQSPKLTSFWRGPYKVVEQLSPYLFRVKVDGRRGTQVVHRSNLFQEKSV